MPRYAATDEFLVALREVEFLLHLAASHESHYDGHAALLKSSLLLLAAKFENLLESIIEECRFELEQKNVSADQLPPLVVFAVIQQALKEDVVALAQASNPKCIDKLKPLVPFLTAANVTSIPIDKNLAFGKHGEEVIRKLFKRIGVSDIFVLIAAGAQDPDRQRKSDTADINSVVALRNNIVHGDASPSMTKEQVAQYVESLKDVSNRLDQSLSHHCAAIGAA